jgi:FKBP-type peptidyl-prolyl cis-trans isomerase (trigger factor)
LSERADAVAKVSLEEEVLKEVEDGSTVAVPDKLVDQQAHRLHDRLERELDSRGLTIEQYVRIRRTSEADLASEFRTEAERSLKRSFVLQAIAEEQELSVSDDEVDASTREAFGADVGGNRSANRTLRVAEIRERVRTALLEQRAAKWLVEHATEGGDTTEPGVAPGEPQKENQ